MRLWHRDLLKKLPRQQLLGQHRECAALRGLGWGKQHSTVNYVFEHSFFKLYNYHREVMLEMIKRQYKPDPIWFVYNYRGKQLGFDNSYFCDPVAGEELYNLNYAEHNNDYLIECLENLAGKGIVI
jgi:uncharacterized protein (TIGR02328 family)